MCDKQNRNSCCFNCCHEREVAEDKLCCKFNVTGTTVASANVIYTTDVLCKSLAAAGTIKNCSNTTTALIQFAKGTDINGAGGTVVRELVLVNNGCLSFVMTGFDTIRAYFAAEGEDTELDTCVTARYRY